MLYVSQGKIEKRNRTVESGANSSERPRELLERFAKLKSGECTGTQRFLRGARRMRYTDCEGYKSRDVSMP